MWSDFKAFISKGNVMDLAVGVIIGGAFGKIVESLVGDMLMPVISKMLGGATDFTNMFYPMNGQAGATLDLARKAGPVLAYGNFITIMINFVLLAFCVFMLVKFVTAMIPPKPPAPDPGPTADQKLLAEIRDLLAARRGMGA